MRCAISVVVYREDTHKVVSLINPEIFKVKIEPVPRVDAPLEGFFEELELKHDILVIELIKPSSLMAFFQLGALFQKNKIELI